MKKNALLFLLSLFALQGAAPQSTIITDFKNHANQYDYLVVSPLKFLAGAQNLAQFRQSFSGYKAGVVLIDSLYVLFDGTGRKSYQKLWQGLKYAYKSWSVPPKTVVLMGTDTVSYIRADSSWNSYGDMPVAVYDYAFRYEDTARQFQPEFNYSDDYYATLADSLPQDYQFWLGDSAYSVIIGRIPCDSAAQCEGYVQKVIDFETNKRRNKSWFNSAIVVSDDTMQGAVPDPLGFSHLDMAETCADSLLRSCFITKIVGCAYPANSDYLKPNAEDSIVKGIDRGNLWSVYIGHGAPYQWSDEKMLIGKDAGRLRNDSMPSVFLSFSCSNAYYVKSFDSSMCKQFLFSRHGGALAFIGATSPSYSDPNAELMKSFFETFHANRQASVGQTLFLAKTIMRDMNSILYAFLGDPAITLSDGQMHMSMARNNLNQVTFTCQSKSPVAPYGNFDVRVYKRDTVKIGDSHFYLRDSLISRQTGSFSNGYFSAPFTDTSVRIVAYVWNDGAEGSIDSTFMASSLPTIARAKRSPDAVTLRIEHEKLVLQAGPLLGTMLRIAALTINGRTVMAKDIAVRADEVTIDPKGLGLASGTYFIRIATVKGIFAQRMILAK